MIVFWLRYVCICWFCYGVGFFMGGCCLWGECWMFWLCWEYLGNREILGCVDGG